MKKISYLIISAIFLVSCNANKITSVLYDMQGRKVSFENLVPNLLGKDIPNNNFCIEDKSARLIVFFDSTTCQSCRVNKLYEWDSIISIETKENAKFETMFIFSPTADQKGLLKRSLATSKFSHVVWFDYSNSFLTNNTFIPKDSRFHVFLLDRNNKIVFVGNPLYGEKIAKLFNQVLKDLIENDGEYQGDSI